MGCYTYGGAYALPKNKTSDERRYPKAKKHVSMLLCNNIFWLFHNLYPITKPVVGSRMDMLKSMYDRIAPGQRTRVAQWAKDQITQNYFNCSIKKKKPWVYATLSKKSQKSIDKIYVHTYSFVSITSEAITVFHDGIFDVRKTVN